MLEQSEKSVSAPRNPVVVVGAGHAGGTVAALLRQYGLTEPITIVGEETIAPYQRPPLSKAWLKGEVDADDLMLKASDFYRENEIALKLGVRAVRIDRDAKRVHLNDGEEIAYDTLILATGSRARQLAIPGVALDGVQALRSIADAEQLKSKLGKGKRLAVVGGGYIGLEAAASARALGAEAVVVELQDRVLARVACEALSTFLQNYHRARGVIFELNASVAAFEGEAGRVTGVRLADGRLIDADIVLVGVGAIPNDDLARNAGIPCRDGVIVDGDARTSDPSIFAIGDVTQRPLAVYDRMHRLESVANVLEQAKQAACAIAGRPTPPHEVTWNWSDQYDLKLQMAGVAFDTDEILIRGDPAAAGFAVFHLRGGRVQAVEAINAPPEFMMGRQLIAAQRPIARERLSNPAVSMKDVGA
ncbi:3-phenylpropionate/trans-cinnamate dioxygenase ferredoxin reductase subunit [Sphingobium subterraneum]|uniref:3-phenylpropionate/trans-cinnamate dioxygenase ferredoxin reductase subunit n=1 Tax=Sphingobium subterraneum TaxID=627688 RepID=A0A841J5A1_9SPHN|nr:FAD-dependent oxidoreductase [Sphingobium subterraneum]MBB6123401.1 3-phenylpropionate/trans-cinnamate dioxygenase ferredoxin reductase subunit [Sphingobium subterraneum]